MGLFGGASRVGIGLTVTLRDRFSRTASTVNSSMGNMLTQMANMSRAQSMAMMASGAAMVAAGGYVIRGYASMVKAAAEYEHTLAAVKAVTRDSIIGMSALDNKAQSVAGSTVHTLDQVASAMKFMGMAGVSREAITQTIDAVAALSESTGHQIEGKGGSADIMTNIMKSFRISAKESERVADILAKGTLSANTSLFDLGEAIKYTAATAMDLNVGLEETTAMVMAMGNAGIQASMAGTAVENMLRYMTTAASGRATKGDKWALQALGMTPKDMKDAHGNLLPIQAILSKMLSMSESMGSVQRQAVFQEIFGVRGKRAGSLLIRALGDYKEFLGDLNNIEPGYASKVAEERRDTIKGDLLLLASAWSKFQLAATSALYYVIRPVLWLAKAVLDLGRAIASIPVVGPAIFGVAMAFAAVLVVVGGLLVAFGSMAFFLNQIKVATGALATAQATQGAASVASWTAQTAAARGYLATLKAIALGKFTTMPIPGAMGGGKMMRGMGGKFMGKMGIFQTLIAWAGKLVRGFTSIGRIIVGFIAPSLTGLVASLASFITGVTLVVGSVYLLYRAFEEFAEWLAPSPESKAWSTDDLTPVSARDYYDNPESFNKEDVVIRYNPGQGLVPSEGEEEKTGDTWLNIYLDGESTMAEKIDKGGSKDIYHELGE